MSKGIFSSQERVVVEREACDLSRASLSEALGGIGLDEAGRLFFATEANVRFRSAYDIVSTVLEANNYELNLENLLSCLECFKLGLRVKLSHKSNELETPVADAYTPCIQFDLPQKGRVGPLLKKFYEEIQAYEAEVARLHKMAIGNPEADAHPADTRKENKQLKRENSALREKLDELVQKLDSATRQNREASKALEEMNILPANVQIGTVHKVSYANRQITLKTTQTTITVPMARLSAVPSPGQKCLISLQEGVAIELLFHEDPGVSMSVTLARVLHVENERCKVRDERRRHWLITAYNVREEEIIRGLSRGQRIALYFVDDHLVRFAPYGDEAEKKLVARIQESLVIKQSSHNLGVPGAAPRSKKTEDEVP